MRITIQKSSMKVNLGTIEDVDEKYLKYPLISFIKT